MAVVLPFRAVRPTPDMVAKVSTLSYEHYSPEEVARVCAQNPYSFLNIITSKSEEFLQKKTVTSRYNSIRKRYKEFKKDEVLIQDSSSCYYLYQIKNDVGTFCGFIAATSTEDYEQNHIKKHEETITAREERFAKYLKNVRFNADPVLLTYPDNDRIAAITKKYTKTPTEYTFSSSPNEQHQLWVIPSGEDIKILQDAFASIPSLYIADGHHRCASSAVLAKKEQENEQESGQSQKGELKTQAHAYFMSYLIPESQVKIFEFNRLVKDLHGHTLASFLNALKPQYEITKLKSDRITLAPHEFSMYLEDSFYHLRLKKDTAFFSNETTLLDTDLLYRTVLSPILGISDPRTDNRIAYFYDNNALSLLKNNVDSREFAVGFGMLPITVETLKNIADADLKMPPKSTYILPKIRSGLLFYEF